MNSASVCPHIIDLVAFVNSFVVDDGVAFRMSVLQAHWQVLDTYGREKSCSYVVMNSDQQIARELPVVNLRHI